MSDAATGWTVLFRDGVPTDWQGASKQVLHACAGRFTAADATRAIRQGQGFLDLLVSPDEATRIERALGETGFVARALPWRECEAADTPVRHTRIDLEAADAVPEFPWGRVEFLHLVLTQGAPFFLPPERLDSTKSAQRIATAVGVGVQLLGLEDFGAANAVKHATGQLLTPGASKASAPELVIELCGLWTPRVHLAVDGFEFACVPGAQGGRRVRLAKLLEALVAKAPRARRLGLVERALAQTSLDGLKPLASHDHRRLVMAWLTARRLWPEAHAAT